MPRVSFYTPRKHFLGGKEGRGVTERDQWNEMIEEIVIVDCDNP